MADRSETAVIVRDALASLWPDRFDKREIAEDVSLGLDVPPFVDAGGSAHVCGSWRSQH